MAHCFFDLKSLEKINGKCFLFEDIIENSNTIFKLRMENTKVCLNGSKKSVYEIRCTILEKNRKYFEAIVKDISLSLISQRQNKENFDEISFGNRNHSNFSEEKLMSLTIG